MMNENKKLTRGKIPQEAIRQKEREAFQAQIRFLFAMIVVCLILIAAMGLKIDRLSRQLVESNARSTCYIYNTKENSL